MLWRFDRMISPPLLVPLANALGPNTAYPLNYCWRIVTLVAVSNSLLGPYASYFAPYMGEMKQKDELPHIWVLCQLVFEKILCCVISDVDQNLRKQQRIRDDNKQF